MSVALTPELQELKRHLVDSVYMTRCGHEACLLGRTMLRSILRDDLRGGVAAIGYPGTATAGATYQEVRERIDQVLRVASPDDLYVGNEWTGKSRRSWRSACPLPGHGGDRTSGGFVVYLDNLAYLCHSHCGRGTALAYLNGGEEPRGRNWWERARELVALLDPLSPELDECQERWAEATSAKLLRAHCPEGEV